MLKNTTVDGVKFPRSIFVITATKRQFRKDTVVDCSTKKHRVMIVNRTNQELHQSRKQKDNSEHPEPNDSEQKYRQR
jgi:hypothetical protein